MEFYITEHGNFAFSNKNGDAVLFAKLDSKGKYIQAGFSPTGWARWNVSTIFLHKEDLLNLIMYEFGGWRVDRCPLEINMTDLDNVISADDVVTNIVNHMVKASQHPGRSFEIIENAVVDSAAALKYVLTERIKEDCYNYFIENF